MGMEDEQQQQQQQEGQDRSTAQKGSWRSEDTAEEHEREEESVRNVRVFRGTTGNGIYVHISEDTEHTETYGHETRGYCD